VTAAVAGRAAGAVRAGAVTQAEKDVLARKVAAAQAAQGGGVPVKAKAVQKAPAAAPTPPPADQPASTPPSQAPAPKASRARTGGWRPRLAGGSTVTNGAGFVLGLIVWGWIVLPFIRGGPDEVRNVARAKFLNKGPDGSWLP